MSGNNLFNGLLGFAAGMLVLGLVCKACGNWFEGSKGDRCPNCGGTTRKRRTNEKPKTRKQKIHNEAKSLLDEDFKIDL